MNDDITLAALTLARSAAARVGPNVIVYHFAGPSMCHVAITACR